MSYDIIAQIYINMKILVFLACIAVFAITTKGFTLYTGGNSWSLDSGTVDSTNYTFTSLPAKFISYFYTSSKGILF
jgi:hypothetical protein